MAQEIARAPRDFFSAQTFLLRRSSLRLFSGREGRSFYFRVRTDILCCRFLFSLGAEQIFLAPEAGLFCWSSERFLGRRNQLLFLDGPNSFFARARTAGVLMYFLGSERRSFFSFADTSPFLWQA